MNLDADGAAAPIPNGPETAERSRSGRFAPGNPGGPGRPKGARHKALLALEAIGAEAAEAVLRRVVEEAQAVCAVLEAQRKAIETAELEVRVAALEECVPEAADRAR